MDSLHNAPEQVVAEAPPRSPRFLRALRTRERSGQAIVEFGLVSMAFFMIVFGTIDFGRAVFMYSQLHNSVQEGARYGKMNPTANYDIEAVVIDSAENLNISPGDIDIHCKGGCYPGCAEVTVEATALFTPLTARLLGLGADDLPIRMHASSTVTAE